ncbi:MAG: hypothetical protein P8010_25005 [Desulfosarcinaceae bacterium]
MLILCACGGGASAPEIGSVSVNNGQSDPYEFQPGTGIVPQGGDWSASRITFRVSEDASLVESFEVSFSGRASNENCDFDYSDVVSVNDLPIADGRFIYDTDELVIEGRFTAPQEAEVTVLWFGYYGGACEVFYNGELMEVVTLEAATTD